MHFPWIGSYPRDPRSTRLKLCTTTFDGEHKKAVRRDADGFVREMDETPFQKPGGLSAAAQEGEATEDAE
jgi:hypothetical protein